MLTELTKEKEAKLAVYRDESIQNWIGGRNTTLNKDKVVALMDFMYGFLDDVNRPPVYLVDSPMELQEKAAELTGKSEYYYTFSFPMISGSSVFFHYFDKEHGISHSSFQEFYKLLESAGFPWEAAMFDEACIVSARPTKVRRDDEKRLHSDQEPSVEWGNGEVQYFLHGLPFEFDLWKKIITKEMTLEEVAKIPDADKQAVAISFLRADRLLKFTNAELVHTGIKDGTKLYKVENFMDTGKTQYPLLMTCPSTGREFIEWAHPDIGEKGDADACQAAACGLSIEDYLTMVDA